MPNAPQVRIMKIGVREIVALAGFLLLLSGCGEFFRDESEDIVGLTIAPLNTTIQPGQTQQFSATGTLGTGGMGDVTTRATWSSSDPGIATIDSAGLATAVGYGYTTISGDSSNPDYQHGPFAAVHGYRNLLQWYDQ